MTIAETHREHRAMTTKDAMQDASGVTTNDATSVTSSAGTNDPTGDGREVRVVRPDGRVVAATDRGPVGAPVVVFLHAAPGSRAFDPDPAATAAAGVRLVTVDRAGYGDSDPIAEGEVPTIGGHAADTAAVLDELGIADAAVVGWSAGGRVALALAAARPELVRSVAVVGTPAPDDEVPWVEPEHRELAALLRRDPSSAVATVVAAFSGEGVPDGGATHAGDGTTEAAGRATETARGESGPPEDLTAMVTAGGEADAAVLEDPAVRARVEAMVAFGFRHGPAGVATDIVADQVATWDFDVAAVGAPVTLVYGDADAVLTPDHGRWYADRLASPTLRVVAGAGHLVVVTEWSSILAAVA